MEIRFLTPEDASKYWDIRLEALRCEPEAFGSSPEEHLALTLEEVTTRICSPPDNFTVGAFEGDRLVGTAGFFRNKGMKERHKGFVWGVYVTLDQRGKGVGRSMLRLLLARGASTEGIEQIQISVATTQEAAGKLYRSLGFASYGVERRALKVGERYIDEEHMALDVAQCSVQQLGGGSV